VKRIPHLIEFGFSDDCFNLFHNSRGLFEANVANSPIYPLKKQGNELKIE